MMLRWMSFVPAPIVLAKLRAYAWTVWQLGSLWAARRGTQQLRHCDDRAILAQHTVPVPIADAADGPAAEMVSRIAGRFFAALGWFALRAMNARAQEPVGG